MTRAVVEAVHPEQVLVFGSHARGDATADSDVDLLVVEKEPFDLGRSRRHELRQIRRALSCFPVPKDVLVYSRDEVERWKNSRNHIIRRASGRARCCTTMNEESARMMELARRDLRAAQGMAGDTVAFTDEIFGFHAQQAVEKACKAWMCGLGVVYPKTHDLDLLFHLLSESGVRVPMEYEALLDLVDFSVQYRYEAFDELPIDRRNTLLLVTQFIEHVAAWLANPG